MSILIAWLIIALIFYGHDIVEYYCYPRRWSTRYIELAAMVFTLLAYLAVWPYVLWHDYQHKSYGD
jgi:hypothetical protein